MNADYFAVPDPLDGTAMSYWYRPKRGRHAGQLAPWPPQGNRWGALYKKDVPADLDAAGRRAFIDAHCDRLRDARTSVEEMIDTDPGECAARFAAFTSRCCMCGKTLTDERSKVYGVGPECRAGMPASLLAHLARRTGQMHAEQVTP